MPPFAETTAPAEIMTHGLALLTGVMVTAWAAWLRGNSDTKAKLDEKAEEVVTEKFESLSGAVRAEIEGHGERLGHIENRLDSLASERHNDRLTITNELNAIRLYIANTTATKADVAELGKAIQGLTNQLARFSAMCGVHREGGD